MISVIIPVYNRAKLIKRAINCVLNQSFKDYEIIVIDDGSTDETLEILESFKEIKVIKQKNFGVSHARNQGIKSSKYPWIAFLDSDDEWHQDKLEKQINFHMQNKDILFSHTNETWIRENKELKQKKQHKKPSGFCFEENLDFCKISPSTVMLKKEIFKKVEYFDENLKVCEDYDLWLRILKSFEIGLMKEALTLKHAEDNQLSKKYHSMDLQRVQALLKHKNNYLVTREIEKKVEILKNGAIKHGNKDILEFCNNALK